MFDISFAELALVAIVALIVIGPDRLPKVARTLGAYTGRLQRYIAQVKDEVNREVNFEELQEMQQDLKSSVDEVKTSIRDGVDQAKQAAEKVEQSIADMGAEEPAAVKKPLASKKPTKKTASRKTAPTKKTTAKNKAVKKNTVESAS